MADGLSLAANIIAVIQLTGEIAFASYKYINGVRGASESLQRFDRQLKTFKYILLKLQNFVNENPSLSESWDLVAQLGKCRADMAAIKLGLIPKKKKWGVQLLWCQWPFKEKETVGFIERFEILKSLFTLAMADFQSSRIRDVGEDVKIVLKATQSSHGSGKVEVQDKPDRGLVLTWLYPEAFNKRHTEISGRRRPNSGEWILREMEVKAWESGKSKSRLLWGYGIPGAGKTFLSSRMIDHLKDRSSKQSKCGVAYIYFNYSEQIQQTPSLVLSSLTKQLACQLEELPEGINELYKKATKRNQTLNLEEFYSMLLLTVKAFSSGGVFLICDALDECDQTKQRTDLLKLFSRMAKDGMNLFITSREFPDDIQTAFKNFPKIRLWAKDEDIKLYIEQKIAEHPRAYRLVESGGCQGEIVSQLKECANGMFLMVSFHVKILCEQVNLKQLLSALKKLNNSNRGEPTMDPTYDRVIDSIRLRGEACIALALKILSWLANSQCVLTVRQLQIAVSIESDCTRFDQYALSDRNTLLDVCAGLITIDQVDAKAENDLKDTVRLTHYTIKEYLIRKSIIPNNGDIQLATGCITYISYENFIQGACISNESEEYKSYMHPFLEYAAQYLHIHLRRCETDSITQMVLGFVETPQCLLVYAEAQLLWNKSYKCQGLTPLHFAAILRHVKVAQVLIEKGASVCKVDSFDCTVLHHANDSDTLIRLLLEKGVDVNAVNNDRNTALHIAAMNGYEPVVKLLLEKGADITAANKLGNTPLLQAAYNGHEPVVKLLLEKGADITAVDNDGDTALHLATMNGHEPVAKLLLEKGADITATNKSGNTPLIRAADGGHEPVVKLLLEKGADITAVDNDGDTVLYLAAMNGHEPVVKLLLEKGADIAAVDNDGDTALHLAAMNDHEPVVKLLLENGANITAVNHKEETPMDIADSRGHQQVVEFLREYMRADTTSAGITSENESSGYS